MDGIDRQMRVGHVPLPAAHAQTAGQGAAPADLDRVAEIFDAGRFPDNTQIDLFAAFAQGFNDGSRSVHSRAFLVGSQQEGDRPQMVWVRFHEGGRCTHEGRDGRLHVRGAAPVKAIAAQAGFKRGCGPGLCRTCRYDVGMAGKDKQGLSRAAPQPEIGDAIAIEALGLETQRFKDGADQIQASAVLGRDRRKTDQARHQVQGL